MMSLFKNIFKRKQVVEEKIEQISDLEFKNYILPTSIYFYPSYIDASNGTFVSYILVKGFPKAINYYSLFNRVGRLKGVKVSMNFVELPISVFENLLNTTMTNMGDAVKKRTDEVRMESVMDKQSDFLRMINDENLKTYSGSIMIKIVGDSKEDLLRKRLNVHSVLKSISVIADDLTDLQQAAYTSFMPFNPNKVSKYGEFPFSANTLANLWIPNYTSYKLPHGYPLGRVMDGGMFCIELFGRKDSNTSNSNFVIFGKSGQGKSYLLKKILLNEAMNGKNVVINDMQDEYVDLIHNLGGHVYNIPRINVMQVNPKGKKFFSALDSIEVGVETNVYFYHLSFLRKWYSTINSKELHLKEDKCFEFLCKEVYKDFGINANTNFNELSNEDYPRLQDVYDKALSLMKIENENLHWKEEHFQSVAQSLEPAVSGSDSEYFNTYTEAVFMEDQQKLICFRLGEIKDLNDNTKNAIYLNVNNYISSLLFSDKEENWLYLWDEFHMVVDGKPRADNYAVREFATVYNIARKFEVSVGFASTSVNNLNVDSVKNYTTAMISQTEFKFIFKTENADYEALVDLFENLNEVEKRMISNQPRFTCLATVGSHRFQVRIDGVDLSNLTGRENPYLLHESRLFGKSGGR